MKLSINKLRERFSSPFIHNDSYEPKEVHPEPIIENIVSAPVAFEPVNVIPEATKKEDSFYIETHIARFNPQNHISSVVLQIGFCCKKPNAKLLVTNHTSKLLGCSKDHCSKIIKVAIGEMN